jgi:hypothetical protein
MLSIDNLYLQRLNSFPSGMLFQLPCTSSSFVLRSWLRNFFHEPGNFSSCSQNSNVVTYLEGRAVVRWLVAGYPSRRRPRFESVSGHVGFVVDKAALRQVLSEYFGFLCHAFPRRPHIHHYPPSTGTGTIGQ